MKSIAIHALLALAGLAFAYQTWTREEDEERPEGEVVVLACEPDQLDALSIETPTSHVKLEPVGSGEGRYYWIESQRKRPKKKDDAAETSAKADAGTPTDAATDEAPADTKPTAATPDAGAAARAEAEAKKQKEEEDRKKREEELYAPKRFMAGSKVDAYLAKIAPLRAVRGLGVIPENEFEPYGFDDVGTWLRIGCGGQTIELEVGGRTFGSGMRYLRDPATQQAYLFDASVTSDIESAQYKFMQVTLHDFELSDVDEAIVRAHGAERTLLQRDRADKDRAQWVDKAEPDRRNETYGNWFDRMARLRVTSYLAEGAEPGSDLEHAGGSSEVVEVEYRSEGKPKDKLELVRVDTDDKPAYYARTGATRTWTRVYDSIAKEVEQDAALVVGAEQPAEPAAPAAPAASPAAAPPVAPHAAPPASPHAVPGANPHAMPQPTGAPAGH